jgi:YesN/AraC family two-component response regulator
VVSANDDRSNIWRAINNGARDYLLKPVRLQEISNIWQHVYRKNLENPEKSSITKEIPEQISLPDHPKTDDGELRKEEDETNPHQPTEKKPRFVWTLDLHCRFVNAIQELGERGKSTVFCSKHIYKLVFNLYIYIYVKLLFMIS